ncbi:MAG: transposase, partial [Bdellovibrio sp.]
MELSCCIPVRFLCKYFSVSSSSYYQWRKGIEPRRPRVKKTICKAIEEIFQESKETYGSPRVYRELRAKGFSVSENTVAKYMKELGLDARL